MWSVIEFGSDLKVKVNVTRLLVCACSVSALCRYGLEQSQQSNGMVLTL